MWFSARGKDPRWPGLKDACKKIQKAPPQQFEEYFKVMEKCVPTFTDHILKECLTKLVEALANRSFPESTSNLVIEIFYKMTSQVDQTKPETNPFLLMSGNNFLFSSLFEHMNVVNHHLSSTILSLWVFDPVPIQKFVTSQQESFSQIIQVITETHDKEYGCLLLLIVSSTPQIKELYIPIIKEALPKWTPSLVISIWVGNPETVSIIPAEEVENWLVSYSVFQIDDIQQIINIHPFLWEKESIALLMARTTPDAKDSSISFIHRKSIQNFAISDQTIKECCDSLRKPLEPFQITADGDSRVSYTFIRYYVLSMCDPHSIDNDIQQMIIDSLSDSSDLLCAAAVQVLYLWHKNYCYNISMQIFYIMAAAAVARDQNSPCRLLLQGILSLLCKDNTTFMRILVADPELRVVINKAKIVTRESFVLPQIKPIFDQIKITEKNEIQLVDLSIAEESLELLVTALEL